MRVDRRDKNQHSLLSTTQKVNDLFWQSGAHCGLNISLITFFIWETE